MSKYLVIAASSGIGQATVRMFSNRQVNWVGEYIRGIYYHFMPGYAEKNTLQATRVIMPTPTIFSV